MDASVAKSPKFVQEKIRSLLEESKQITMSNLRDDIVTLKVTLNSSTLFAIDTFQIPSGRNFLIREIRAHLAPANPWEVPPAPGMGPTYIAPSPGEDFLVARAFNTRIRLFNQDRSDLKVIESDLGTNNSLCLASIFPAAGGSSIDFGEEFPLLVPAVDFLRMEVTAQNATIAAGSCEYGVTLIGSMVAITG